MEKFKKHIPFHLYLDGQIYFITASALNKNKYFNTDEKLKILKDRFISAISQYKISVYAWIILPNHYHWLFRPAEGKDLPSIIGFINGGSAHDLNVFENIKNRKIWWNYWDNCIRGERDFYKRFNYIHHNAVKHGYVKSNSDYQFSSYHFYKNKYGEEFLADVERFYPISDFTDSRDNF